MQKPLNGSFLRFTGSVSKCIHVGILGAVGVARTAQN
jgi:hypothetical protein